MGKLNEIQEQVTQSYGNNSFTTKITDDTVEFDSARDSFTFKDVVNVPSMKINGTESQPFTSEEKTKLSHLTTPMNIRGRVDSVSDLPTEDVQVGDVYLVGPSDSENFAEYVCTEISGSPATPVWEFLGNVKAQSNWNQNDRNADDYIKNRTHYVEITDTETIVDDDFSFTSEEDSGLYYNNYIGETDLDFFDPDSTYFVTIGDGIYEIVSDNMGQLSYESDGGFDANGILAFEIYVMRNLGGDDYVLSISVTSDAAYTTEHITIDSTEEEVHTLADKFIPDTIARVDDIPTQVQADWNQTNTDEPDYIKNKPTIPAAQVQSNWNQTNTGEPDYIKNKPTIPAAQVQSDWNQSDNTKVDYIKNKPTIPAAQVQSNWTQSDNTKLDYIKNKPSLAAVATSGDYTDLTNKPTIPTEGVDLVSPSAASSYTLASDKYYSLGTLSGNKTIIFSSPTAGKTGIYSGQFSMGSTVVTVTFPVGVTFKTTPVYAANKTYQFSVVNNLGVIVEF